MLVKQLQMQTHVKWRDHVARICQNILENKLPMGDGDKLVRESDREINGRNDRKRERDVESTDVAAT